MRWEKWAVFLSHPISGLTSFLCFRQSGKNHRAKGLESRVAPEVCAADAKIKPKTNSADRSGVGCWVTGKYAAK